MTAWPSSMFASRLPAGDANTDALVDPLDNGAVLSRLGCDVDAFDPGCVRADVNNDGTVDPLDVGAVQARLGHTPCSCD